MKRRSFLAATGVGVLAGLAGCSGDSTGQDGGSSGAPFAHAGTLEESFTTNGDFPSDEDPADGYPPEFSDPPASPDADPSSFETLDVNGETVRLAPIDVVRAWYRRGEARMVDGRGVDSYVEAHVYGAVNSTFQQGSTGGGIDGWTQDDRVVTYCTCPHHISTVRAAGLQKAGFSNVFAIDEGFGPWLENGYPMAGRSFASSSQSQMSEWTISGIVPASYADETVRAAIDRQYEAGPIADDGSFELHFLAWNVDESTPVELSTPVDTVTRSLGDLATGTVDLA